MGDRAMYVSEAAKLMGFSDPTLRRWIAKGEVHAEHDPGGRLRIRESEVRRVRAWFDGEPVPDAVQSPNSSSGSSYS